MRSSPPSKGGGGFAEFVVRLTVGRPRTILILATLWLGLAGWRVTRLRLDTDFAELLPQSAPAVAVWREMNRRMAGLSSLDLVVQGPDATTNRRFVDALVPHLRALHDPLIQDVSNGVHEEQAFFDRNKYLFASPADLESARDRLTSEIAQRKNPFLTNLDDDGPHQSLGEIEQSIDKRSPFARFPEGYFAYPDRSLYVVVIWLRSSLVAGNTGEHTAHRIREAAIALAHDPQFRSVTVGLTGSIITAAEERAALQSDLVLATILSVCLVCAVVFLFFGRLASLPYMIVPALCGVGSALAFAQLSFGFLNTATSFMAPIIVGNGINYAIVQMARYEEERRRGRTVAESLEIAIRTTWRATGLAAFAAALAYGSLVVTAFRGFNQFGYIGAVGMILAWLATLLVLPSLWVLFDRRPRVAPRIRGFAAAAPLARFVMRHPRAILVAGIALTVAALAPLPRYLADPFEYNFRKLRNRSSQHSDTELLSHKLDPIFGRSLSPGFVLADRPSQTAEIRAKLLARDPTHSVIGSVKTVAEYLPGPPAEQRQKLALLDEIRAKIDKNSDFLHDNERARIARLRPPGDLRVLAPPDLPRSVRRFYTEADGTVGRLTTWFPRDDVNMWDGRVLIKLSSLVRDIRLGDGTRIQSSGQAVIFAAMIDAVVHDGPLVTAVSFFAVLLLVIALARGRGAWLIVGSLCVGVAWMVGAVAWAGVRINFLNFIALPITFGIAADYAANLYLRYRSEGPGRVEESVASTGGAVALCSLTTIIGYASLLVADTEGLRTFGAAAILGELGCITTAIVLMPAVLILLERRRRPIVAQRDAEPQ